MGPTSQWEEHQGICSYSQSIKCLEPIQSIKHLQSGGGLGWRPLKAHLGGQASWFLHVMQTDVGNWLRTRISLLTRVPTLYTISPCRFPSMVAGFLEKES